MNRFASQPFIVALTVILGSYWVARVSAVEAPIPQRESEPKYIFERDVRPILKAMCFHCHGEEEELRGGFDSRLVRLMKSGGESGTAITPGDASASLLWQRVDADEMPEGKKKLSSAEKLIIRDWIDQGALTARPEPDDVNEARFTLEERNHWAFQPIASPPVPQVSGYRVRTPIDAFIAAKLSQHDLPFSPQADRSTLIRRITFDLTGLPPTPDEVKRFLSDPHPDAYERLVDRLLASPQYGVRWARHWLDVAGYAESQSDQGNAKRPHAWRYRDYVIQAFNQNRPIDQFYREQLAGDEMITGPLRADNDEQRELLTATGFLRMAPDATQTRNNLANRNLAAADAVKVISSSMLGLTVGCAQCHDHKYDPIGIDDYYRFRAIFDPLFPLNQWQVPDARLVDFSPAEEQAEADRIEKEAQAMESDLNTRRTQLGEEILARKLADVPEQDRQATSAAVKTESAERTKEQQRLLDLYPMVKPVSSIVGILIEYDMPSYRKFEKEQQQIAAFRATKPPKRMVMAARERAGIVPKSTVFFRGNPEAPRQEVPPKELSVLLNAKRPSELPINDTSYPTTGRRFAYANQLTQGQHPLAARVFVNRVWLHHFGRGLVNTPSDFGLSGDPPSHAALLDWIADDFQRNGWDLKRLHRLILLSTTFQQQATRTPAQDSMDPENRLLARANLRRLAAEEIRDAILSVSHNLTKRLGGPSIPVTEDPEGKVVIGKKTLRDGIAVGVESHPVTAQRRSIYIELQRNLPLNMLATFDQPIMSPNCSQRKSTTVATQSLWFLNDAAILNFSTDLAKQITQANRRTFDQQLDEIFLRLFAVPPSPSERQSLLQFKNQLEQLFLQSNKQTESHVKTAEVQAIAALCQTLMASNRFLYVD
ncbi:MAG: DUF1549 domain-containing protein [Planctomycetaceae bacterium]|nr:DUF1549 domain-containing protein [Planctomycetaceae bacterium]